MTAYVFIFLCSTFGCHGTPLHGDGLPYETRGKCKRAAYVYAREHKISLGRYEISCVERAT